MTQTIELLDKNVKNYFTWIPYVQEATKNIELFKQRYWRYLSKIKLLQMKTIITEMKYTVNIINSQMDTAGETI